MGVSTTHTHILAQYRDLILILLERSTEGKEANRDLTDTVREKARETCTLATIAAGQLRNRELSKNFGRVEYLHRLHDAVSTRNIPYWPVDRRVEQRNAPRRGRAIGASG